MLYIKIIAETQNYNVLANCNQIFLVRGGGPSEDLSKIGGIKSAMAVLDVGKLFLLLNEILKNKSNKVYVYMITGIVDGIVVGIALASIILKS